MAELTRQRLRRIQAALLLGALLLAAAALWQTWSDYRRFADKPLRLAQAERTLEVERGDGFVQILRKLRRAGVRRGPDWYWRGLAWEMGVLQKLQVGEYALDHGITPRELLQRMEQGKVVQHRFTIIEGWNVRELREALRGEAALTQTIGALSDGELMQQLGAGDIAAEGRFLPETYLYTRGTTDLDLLKRAHAALQQALQQCWEARTKDLPLTSPEQALILASIIEKETGVAAERPAIAGVFTRRLQRGMRLQTDPTVIYGIGSAFDGNLTRAHLEADTPFNTYTRDGLPPTPIALPGRAALCAATQPGDGDSLYFVSRGDGSHEFSVSLDAHNAAVRRYQLKQP